MKVNGNDHQLEKAVPLTEFLESQGYILSHIAIELNGGIVPKAQYNDIMLSDADTLEIVNFVGGG